MENARILVVEDQKIISLEIKERLEEMGHQVVGLAKSGDKAIELALKHFPDLILMDIKIEGDKDGIETADEIRKLMDCPVIFLTAYADDKTIERAKLTEPYAYIVKPLDERELKSAIVIALYKNEISKRLKDSEIKYRTAINSLEGSFYVVDYDYNLILNNSNVEGLMTGDKAGMKCYKLLYNIDAPCKHCTMSELSLGRNARTEFFDKRNNKWQYMISVNVDLSNGEKYAQHLMVDITDRKKNEESVILMLEEKETMLREIHHRVKNNLQLMLSLIRLQEANSSDVSVKSNLQTIQIRLNSMALVHEDLYSSSDLAKVPFTNYIKKLITNLERMYQTHARKIKIECEIDHVFLPVDAAIPVGIIINELVTNSIKHAFPQGKEGNIYIDFRKQNEKFVLTVKDDGTGMNSIGALESPKGLGLKIFNILSRQLNCFVELSNDPGAAYKLILDGVSK